MKEAPLRVESAQNAQPVGLDDLEGVYRAHHARVIRIAYRVTGSFSDAEDVAQTVFLRLARRGLDSVPVGHIESYLYRAAVNAALDVLRSRKDAKSVNLEDAGPLPSDDALLSPDRTQESAEIRIWLRQALSKLHPRAAEMFVLRYLENYDNREIARLLDTSSAVVAVMLHRTRGRLQKDFRAFMRGSK